LVDCPHRRHARGHWGGNRNDPGPLVEALLERGFRVYGINPKQLDRFRDRFTVAGAKDDRRDAHVLGDSLRTDRHAFRRLSNDEPVIVKLREWSGMADDLQQERARLASRMREQLWRYYRQMLDLADDLAADWFLDLWS
jgi:Transposase